MRALAGAIVALAAATAALAACGGGEPERELQPGTLPVGVFSGTVGGNAETERLIVQGARVAVREINDAGGIDGVLRIRLVDGRAEADGSYAQPAQRLLQGGARALILPCGGALRALAVIARRGDALGLAPCADEEEALPPEVVGTGLGRDSPVMDRRPEPGGELDEFYERYKALFGRRPSSSVPALGYDAVKVLATAVDVADSPRRALVEHELRDEFELVGAFGTIRYERGRLRPTIELEGVEG